ncbi:hypothetical protein EVAR_15075_1 [Eumeta japonica]|uniref:Uncharacterized protein n=1 Tax=Eumeta variegata TaxID=151549 RepID=A0A4C1YI29_EUMVA|nr:hypothetical protein EVAR_15075_1 [Eumeta japonica]
MRARSTSCRPLKQRCAYSTIAAQTEKVQRSRRTTNGRRRYSAPRAALSLTALNIPAAALLRYSAGERRGEQCLEQCLEDEAVREEYCSTLKRERRALVVYLQMTLDVVSDVNVPEASPNEELEFIRNTVSLGITFDDGLQWSPYIADTIGALEQFIRVPRVAVRRGPAAHPWAPASRGSRSKQRVRFVAMPISEKELIGRDVTEKDARLLTSTRAFLFAILAKFVFDRRSIGSPIKILPDQHTQRSRTSLGKYVDATKPQSAEP